MTSDIDIKNYHTIRWQSLLSISADYFKFLLQDPSLKNNFDKEFAKQISDKCIELNRIEFRLLFLLLPLILVLGAFNSEFAEDIVLFGINFYKYSTSVSVILFVSSIFMLLSTGMSLVSAYYNKVLEAYVEAYHDERVVNYVLHQYQWNISSIFDGARSRKFHIFHNLITISIVGFWFLSLVCATILIKLVMFLIVMGATISTLNASDIPDFIVVPTVLVAACAMVFEFTSFLLQCPLPFTDRSNMKRLEELEKTDPILADEIQKKIGRRGLDKDRRNSIVLQAIVLIAAIVVPAFFDSGTELLSNKNIAFGIVLALGIMFTFVSPIVSKVENKILKKVFEKLDKELAVKQYVSTKKWILNTRIILAAIVGFAVFSQYH